MKSFETNGRRVAETLWDGRNSSIYTTLWEVIITAPTACLSEFVRKRICTVCDGPAAHAVCRWVLTVLTFRRRNYFFLILAHRVYKM